jgi:DMSO/TMAO reductase YedYZ molybdopterin-dependent catalytic subunit
MPNVRLPRRRILALGAAWLGGTLLTGCDRLSESSDVQEGLSSAEWLTYRVQRLLGGRHALAREFTAADLSPVFKVNGSRMPEGEEYAALLESNFAHWRLRVDGLVAKPLQLSLADLRNLPQRTQITRHDCVEGWSAIGKWQGVPLAIVLARAALLPAARFVVFHCADILEPTLDGTGQYYESIDLIDAFHPQTILAHSLNDVPLPVDHGAPLRLQARKIRDAHRGDRPARRVRARQGRVLGRSRVRVVCRDLKGTNMFVEILSEPARARYR